MISTIRQSDLYSSCYIFAKRCKPIVHGWLSYFNPANLLRALQVYLNVVSPKAKGARKIWARDTQVSTVLNDEADALKRDGFVRVPSLSPEMISVMSARIEGNGIYTLLGKKSTKKDAPIFEGVLPDYKFVYLKSSDLTEDDWGKLVTPDLLACVSSAAGMNMKVNWATLYRTYSRKLDTLKTGGRYVSFDWHFDNPAFPNVFKVMFLLTPVNSVDDGAFELQCGRRYKTLLRSLGNSRLTFLSPKQSSVEIFTGKPGDGALFDVACAHRGGLTSTVAAARGPKRVTSSAFGELAPHHS